MNHKVTLLISWIWLSWFTCSAQMLTTDNVNVSITAGTQVTVVGDIQNQNAATITNNGTIDLSGNWTNNAANNCFGTSAGTVIFKGANQSIGGTSSTTFNNLTLIGTGLKTLTQDITVGGAYASPAGVLSLGDRNLDLNSRTLSISNSSVAAITRTTGFAVSETQPVSGYGYIRWNIGTMPAGNNYTFPFGNRISANYLPLNFNITTAGTGNGYVRIATYPTSTAPNPNNRPLPTGLTALINNLGLDNSNKVVDRYYIFDVQGYLTPPVTSMVFTYRDSEWNTGTNAIVEANLKIQRLNNGTQWTQPPFGTVNITNNTVTVTGQSIYSPIWTIVDLTSPLPVNLIDFTANLNSDLKTDLKWQAVNEVNCANYEIQKSNDSKTFETCTVVPSKGNSNGVNNYSSVDETPFNGVTYYRLKINDFNGDYTFSKTVSVHLSNTYNLVINVYPNPMTTEAVLQLVSKSEISLEHLNVVISDLLGRKLMDMPLKTLNRNNDGFIFSRASMTAGIYHLSILNNDELMATSKLIIQ